MTSIGVIENVSLTLLGVTITVFVLSVSLLGRAIERSQTEQARILQERSERLQRQKTEVEKRLGSATSEAEVRDLEAKLKRLRRELRTYRKKLRRANRMATQLGVVGVVIVPGTAFLLSIVCAEITQLVIGHCIKLLLISVSLLSLLVGIYFLLKSLRALEFTALTTEDVSLRQTTIALQKALEEHEDRRTPKLRLKLTEPSPIEVSKGAEFSLEFALGLRTGFSARGVEVWCLIPPGFRFIDAQKVWQQGDTHEKYPGYWTTIETFESIKKGVTYESAFKIKAPDSEGVYTAYLHAVAENCPPSDDIPIELKIVPS